MDKFRRTEEIIGLIGFFIIMFLPFTVSQSTISPSEKYVNVSVDWLVGELIQKHKVLRSVKEEVARLSSAYLTPEKNPQKPITPYTFPPFEKFDNMTADQLISKIRQINKMLQISKAEMVRLSYIELEKNPNVKSFISKEHLRQMVEEEKNNLYYYTEDEFFETNSSTSTTS